MTTVWCPAPPLEEFVAGACRALGAADDIAAEVAHHLVRANLSGHDSHGVLRLPWYADQVARGDLHPAARPSVVRETPGAALFDAGRGFGHYSTLVALEWALAHARAQGVAAATVRNSTHIGRLGEYTERGAGQGLVTIITIGSAGETGRLVAPFGGRERFLGTNPWSFGAPAAGRPPMMFDAATSVIAEGKIRVAQAKGVPLPPGCILDGEGRPSTTPDDFYAGGMLLPVGGETAGYKGYGYSMAAALVGGLAMSADPAPDAGAGRPSIGGVTVLALDPAAFGGADTPYAARVGATLDAVAGVTPAPGVPRVLAPGEPEELTRAERGRAGIPLPEATWRALEQLAGRLDVALPEHRAE
ncbi:MAG TPA: Ldh family oxidoreductase [Thermomicrobiales bacterium]|nr:Ldh family oxidoreductase [Thermomicrobiales bacterium]